MRYVHPEPLAEGRGDGVGGVYPAVSVDHVLRDLLSVDAVYGVPDVLARGDDEAEREQDHHRDGVVETEHRGVDVHVGDLDEVLEATEDIQHLAGLLLLVAALTKLTLIHFEAFFSLALFSILFYYKNYYYYYFPSVVMLSAVLASTLTEESLFVPEKTHHL